MFVCIELYLQQIGQEPQHVVIRYKNAHAFQFNHSDRNFAKKDVQFLATSFRLTTRSFDLTNGQYHWDQFVKSEKNIMYNYELIKIYRKMVNIKLQMTKSTKLLLKSLSEQLYIQYAQYTTSLLNFIGRAFKKLHERFRCALWGMWNLNVAYKTYLKETILDKIFYLDSNNDVREKAVKVPKYGGLPSIDNILRKWIGVDRKFKLKHYPLNSKVIIKYHGKTLH